MGCVDSRMDLGSMFASVTLLDPRSEHAIPSVFGLLAALPDGFEGDVGVGEDLENVVDRLRVSRGGFIGVYCFQVDGTTVISDPIIERIDAKFSKKYKRKCRLLQFSRVWVFDGVRRAVLLTIG